MASGYSNDHLTVLGALTEKGLCTSPQLMEILGKSQATVSRLLTDLRDEIIVLGQGKSTRYAIPQSIHQSGAEHALYWIDESGSAAAAGRLISLHAGQLYVEIDGQETLSSQQLPWFLTPLRAQGFLGRLLAQRLAGSGVPTNPDAWNLESVLHAARHMHDAPGSIIVGLPGEAGTPPLLPEAGAALHRELDRLAADVAATLPAGSSAGGEQPKFLAITASGQHVLVKFTPPRGTPFGERWHDLLQAEWLAARVLSAHGVPVAASRVIETPQRTYHISDRFDRIGARGRRHVVSVGAVHYAFVAGPYQHWSHTCDGLARARRLDAQAAAQVSALFQFGRLIGNSDMHSGNLGLFVDREGLRRGRFTLAPVYDMLPMRWRPNPLHGGVDDFLAFEPDLVSLSGPALAPATEFWERLAELSNASRPVRRTAGEMFKRLRDFRAAVISPPSPGGSNLRSSRASRGPR